MKQFRRMLCAVAFSALAAAATPAQVPAGTAPRPLFGSMSPARSCESLLSLSYSGTLIDSARVESDAGTRVCRIEATVTHAPASDRVRIAIELPMDGWNGRFLGTGGGGFSGGNLTRLRPQAALGYAVAATDTGHEGSQATFALDATGHLDWMSIRDNAYLGIHEMTVLGKALAESYYGRQPRYAYFNGCSTGGRQGLGEVQRYPADYDGVMAGAPAVNFHKLSTAQLWGPVVMLEGGNVVEPCKFAAAQAASIAACDLIDGVRDGVIGDPRRCAYDAQALVGTPTACGVVTAADATAINRIWQGPRRKDGSFLWYGVPRGAEFSVLNKTGGAPAQILPFGIAMDWTQHILTGDPQWDWKTLSQAGFEQLFDRAVEQFGAVYGTDSPDLSAFRDRGGKVIVWHGEADQFIYPQGTIDYLQRVQKQMGGESKTAGFIRLFMAPGVAHCGGGPGSQPSGQLEALQGWVEEGRAPATLPTVRRDAAGVTTGARPLCPWPQVARYKGRGSVDDAGNFSCSASY